MVNSLLLNSHLMPPSQLSPIPFDTAMKYLLPAGALVFASAPVHWCSSLQLCLPLVMVCVLVQHGTISGSWLAWIMTRLPIWRVLDKHTNPGRRHSWPHPAKNIIIQGLVSGGCMFTRLKLTLPWRYQMCLLTEHITSKTIKTVTLSINEWIKSMIPYSNFRIKKS